MEEYEIEFVAYGRAKLEGKWQIGSRVVNRLYVIHGGSGAYIKGGEKYKFKKNHLYLLPVSLDIALENDLNDPIDHTFFDFVMCPASVMDSEIVINLDDNELISSATEVLIQLIKKFGFFSGANDRERKLVNMYFTNILCLLNESHHFRTIGDERINDTIIYIHKNYTKNITVQELAQNVYMETNHFIKVFKKHMHVSPYQYIKDYRFSIAYSMLNSGVRVGDVARQTGFLSVSAFSNAYKKKYGIYPGEVCRN